MKTRNSTARQHSHSRTNQGHSLDSLADLKPGVIFRGRWKIVREIGRGGTGFVYEVAPLMPGDPPAALKLEPIRENCRKTLWMDISVLKKLEGNEHIPKYISEGKTKHWYYMVMQLLGPDLAVVHRRMPTGRFTMITTLRIGIQIQNAIHHMHRRGYIHRDIKPHNFALGHNESRNIFLIDFGMSRGYAAAKPKQPKPTELDRPELETHNIRAPKGKVKFRGTLRYCSVAMHMGQDVGQKDDYISLLYSMVDMYKGLPWAHCRDREEIMMRKESCHELFDGCPHELRQLYRFLRDLKPDDNPDTDNQVHNAFDEIMKRKGYDMKAPYDWEPGGFEQNSLTILKADKSASSNPRKKVIETPKHDEIAKPKNDGPAKMERLTNEEPKDTDTAVVAQSRKGRARIPPKPTAAQKTNAEIEATKVDAPKNQQNSKESKSGATAGSVSLRKKESASQKKDTQEHDAILHKKQHERETSKIDSKHADNADTEQKT